MTAGAAMGADMVDTTAGIGYASFVLQEGDVFKLSAKPTKKGAVKVKQIKK